jgi:hypothetical protein
MRHLLIAAAMMFGALVVTSVASIALENRASASARAQPSTYEPPALVASPATDKKPENVFNNGAQRARPRVAGAPGQRA